MICCICETIIKSGESIYWEINEPESRNEPLHTDCLIRLAEFAGNSDLAREIHEIDFTESINRGHKPIL